MALCEVDLDAAYSVDVPAKDVAEFAKSDRTEAKLKIDPKQTKQSVINS